MYACEQCGCHTTSRQRCDACGVVYAASRGAAHRGVTKVFTSHSDSATGIGEDGIHSLKHIHHFDSDQAASFGVPAAGSGRLEEAAPGSGISSVEDSGFRTLVELNAYLAKEEPMTRSAVLKRRPGRDRMEKEQEGRIDSAGGNMALFFRRVRRSAGRALPAAGESSSKTVQTSGEAEAMAVQRGRKKNGRRPEIEALAVAAEAARLSDLRFFLTQLQATADSARAKAERAATVVEQLKATSSPARGWRGGAVARCPDCNCDSASLAVGRRCDCCGTRTSVPTEEARKQRGAGVVGVFTMHRVGTQLDDEERHVLLHTHHFDHASTQDPNAASDFLPGSVGASALAGKLFGTEPPAGALFGRDVLKENCGSCLELEAMMAIQGEESVEADRRRRLAAQELEAIRLTREWANLDSACPYPYPCPCLAPPHCLGVSQRSAAHSPLRLPCQWYRLYYYTILYIYCTKRDYFCNAGLQYMQRS